MLPWQSNPKTPWSPPQKPQNSSDHIRCRNSQLYLSCEETTKQKKGKAPASTDIKKLLPVFKSTVNSCWDIYTGFTLKKWYEIKSENVCRCICVYILKMVQKDLVWFHIYLILPNLVFNYRYSINTKDEGWVLFTAHGSLLHFQPQSECQ